MNPSSPQQEPAQTAARASDVRVAFFSDAYPERNGTGAYYHDLVPQLRDQLAGLCIFQPGCERESTALLSMAMPGDPNQRLETPPLREIRRRCDELRPTIIVVVTPGLYGLLGVYEARRQGATLISAFHTDFEQLARMYWSPVPRFFVNLVLRTVNGIVCRASHSVLVNNAGLRSAVERLGARRIDVIGTPLPHAFLGRAVVPIPDRLRRVCFAGRLAPEKNVDVIIKAARSLPEVEFVIAGDGPLRSELERDAGDCRNLTFAGWLDRAALIELIDSASLLLLPSAFETFGSIALEAMARGRPALVTLNAGIAAWPALHGGLITIEQPAELPAAIHALQARSAPDWEALSGAAREAAMRLNGETLQHWTGLLSRYQSRRCLPDAGAPPA